MNKKISIVFALAVLLVSILVVLIFTNNFKDDLVWESTTDGDANPMQVLSMSEEEIEHYELSCLEKEYTSFWNRLFGEYIYEFKKDGICYDYREDESYEILVGYLSDPWRQVSQIGISEKESFGLIGSYRNLVQKSEMEHGYISYLYQGKWHNAYMIAYGAQVAPKTSGDIVQATRY